MIDDDLNLVKAINKIKKKNHPESYHEKNLNHPGSDWYLKTVCPNPELLQIDKHGYGLLWFNLYHEHPDKIKLISVAYDWNGTRIPYMTSIWVNKNYDIIFNYNDITGFKILVVDYKTGNEQFIRNLKSLLSTYEDNFESIDHLSDSLNEISYIKDIIDSIENMIDSNNIFENNEIDFKILQGGKIKK